MFAPTIFGGNTGRTYEDLQRQKALADQLAKGSMRPANTIGGGLSQIGQALAYRNLSKKNAALDGELRDEHANSWSSIMGALNGSAPGLPASGDTPAADSDWSAIRQGIFAGESGGDYDALFGYSNRPGGQFEGAKLTNMTVDQALSFADPSGPYGQWVKGKVGRVATPMGAYQVVGSTLKAAKEGLGLSGNETMTPQLQEQIGQWIYKTQGTDAWEGYKGPRSGGGVDMGQVMQLAELAASPYASDGQKAVVQALMGQTMQANDPMRQLQMQKAQIELEQMRNPQMTPYQQAQLDLQQQKLDTPDPTSDQRNYQFYSQQEKDAGREPLSFNEWNLQSRRAGATQINNSVNGGVDLTTANKTQQQKVNIASSALDNAFQRYADLIQEYGAELTPGKAKDAILAERRNIQLQMKELFNLGVLNGPDLELMNQMMLDPTDPLTVAGGVIGNLTGGDDIRGRSLANIQQLRGMFGDMQNSWQTGGLASQAKTPTDAPTENPYLNLSQEEFSTMDISDLTPEQIDQLFEARQ